MTLLVLLAVGVVGCGVAAWRSLSSYTTTAWIQNRLADRGQRVTERQLLRRVIATALEARIIDVGRVRLPEEVRIATHPDDALRGIRGAQELGRNATSAIVRMSRRDRWRVPPNFRVTIVPDRHTSAGRPQLLSDESERTDPAPTAIVFPPPSDRAPASRTRPARTLPLTGQSGIRTAPFVATELLLVQRTGSERLASPQSLASLSDRATRLVIGRDGRGDLLLPWAETVSAPHASIEPDGSRWILRDLGSLNGTYLNGNLIQQEAALVHMDEIQLGPDGPCLLFSRLSSDLPVPNRATA
jgi:hypothetical protein